MLAAQAKNWVSHIYFFLKKKERLGPIVYLATLKRGAIRDITLTIDIGLSNVPRISVDFLNFVTTWYAPGLSPIMFRRPLRLNGMYAILNLHVIWNLKSCHLIKCCAKVSSSCHTYVLYIIKYDPYQILSSILLQLTVARWRATSGGHCGYAVQMPPTAQYNYAGWAMQTVLTQISP